MTKLKTQPPNFNEGWDYIPDATKFEVGTEGDIRQFGNKKIVKPNSKGLCMLFNDAKELKEYDGKELAKLVFGEKKIETIMESPPCVAFAKEENSEQSISTNPTTDQMKNTAKSGKGQKKAQAPKSKQSPKGPAKVAGTKGKAHAKAKSAPVSIAEKQQALAANKKQPKEKKLSVTFQVHLMHHQGKTGEEIMKALNLNNKQFLDKRWLYDNKGGKEKVVKYLAANKK